MHLLANIDGRKAVQCHHARHWNHRHARFPRHRRSAKLRPGRVHPHASRRNHPRQPRRNLPRKPLPQHRPCPTTASTEHGPTHGPKQGTTSHPPPQHPRPPRTSRSPKIRNSTHLNRTNPRPNNRRNPPSHFPIAPNPSQRHPQTPLNPNRPHPPINHPTHHRGGQARPPAAVPGERTVCPGVAPRHLRADPLAGEPHRAGRTVQAVSGGERQNWPQSRRAAGAPAALRAHRVWRDGGTDAG
uniref:(northern house mosquito) hypothetical protein n=1 Tax=Culex pipiens TaxID=7175 RepID=A0A8D8F5G3_CULPI